MSKIIVAGGINMALMVQVERRPDGGETVFGKSVQYMPGGKAGNQAVAARRLGANVAFYGRTGDDAWGGELRAFLGAEGIDVTGLQSSAGATSGLGLAVVDNSSQNAIVIVSGANRLVTVDDIAGLQPDAEDIVVCTLEIPIPVVRELLELCRRTGSKTILNAAPIVSDAQIVTDLPDVLIVNEIEAALLSIGGESPEDFAAAAAQARCLRGRDRQTVIVTLGARGVLMLGSDGKEIAVVGRKVPAVDTTAAGDCFVGAFAAALLEGQPPPAALEFANAAASICVQTLGSTTSLPRRDAVDLVAGVG